MESYFPVIHIAVDHIDEKGDAGQVPTEGNMTPSHIIQLPQHLVPLLMPKKDPVKIGKLG